MRAENKIPITELCARLNAHTPDPDPEGAFDAAFFMWRHYCLRHKIHKAQFFSQALQKGWLVREHADHLWSYITGENHF